jgi:hypothetical protein
MRRMISLEDSDEVVMKSDGTDDEMMIVAMDSQRSQVHQLCTRSRPLQCLDFPSRCILYLTECRSLLLVSQVSSLRHKRSNLLLQDIELKD